MFLQVHIKEGYPPQGLQAIIAHTLLQSVVRIRAIFINRSHPHPEQPTYLHVFSWYLNQTKQHHGHHMSRVGITEQCPHTWDP